MAKKLLELAKAIGWVAVNDDESAISLEYTRRINDFESIRHIFKLLTNLNDIEFLNALGALIDVLPRKLKKRIFKLLKNSDLNKKDDLIDLAIFAIVEYKAQSEYTKLEEYAALLKVDLAQLGYDYCYELTKKERNEILSKIEKVLPIEFLPQVGKIKKTEYKIGYVRVHVKTE